MESTVRYHMAWLVGVQALRGAARQLSGPGQAAWAVGSEGWWASGP